MENQFQMKISHKAVWLAIVHLRYLGDLGGL